MQFHGFVAVCGTTSPYLCVVRSAAYSSHFAMANNGYDSGSW